MESSKRGERTLEYPGVETERQIFHQRCEIKAGSWGGVSRCCYHKGGKLVGIQSCLSISRAVSGGGPTGIIHDNGDLVIGVTLGAAPG